MVARASSQLWLAPLSPREFFFGGTTRQPFWLYVQMIYCWSIAMQRLFMMAHLSSSLRSPWRKFLDPSTGPKALSLAVISIWRHWPLVWRASRGPPLFIAWSKDTSALRLGTWRQFLAVLAQVEYFSKDWPSIHQSPRKLSGYLTTIMSCSLFIWEGLLAKEQGSYLTWRTGGGSCLGIVHSKIFDKNRHWLLFGIEKIYGPVAVQELLESLDWAVAKGKNSPWQFLGKPNAHADTLESNYQIEGDHGRTQYLRIVAHNRTNKAACAGMCMRLEPKIAETQMDTQETIIFPTLKDSPSHGKEKASKRRS